MIAAKERTMTSHYIILESKPTFFILGVYTVIGYIPTESILLDSTLVPILLYMI